MSRRARQRGDKRDRWKEPQEQPEPRNCGALSFGGHDV